MEDFEHIISYLREYIAICKEKKDKFLCFSVLLEFESIKDSNKLDEQNKQMNFPQCHRGFVGLSGSHCSPLEVQTTRLFFLLFFYKIIYVQFLWTVGGRASGWHFSLFGSNPDCKLEMKTCRIKVAILVSTCFGWSITTSNSPHLTVARTVTLRLPYVILSIWVKTWSFCLLKIKSSGCECGLVSSSCNVRAMKAGMFSLQFDIRTIVYEIVVGWMGHPRQEPQNVHFN